MNNIHPLIPNNFVDSLDYLLDELKTDFGFKEFNEESSPQIYQGLSFLYFFELGYKINELDPKKSQLRNLDLLYQLNNAGLISSQPKNRTELKTTFENLFTKTSEYLRNLK
jgi:hypothetical protein